MRHRVYGKHLSRDKNQRTALFRSLVRELLLHQSIQTTEVKAKAIKGLVDRLIVKGKKADTASRRFVNSFLVQPELVKKLMEEVAPKYTDRPSGFTTSVRLGTRAGDGAMLVRMSLLAESDKREQKSKEVKKVNEAVEIKKVKKSRVTKKIKEAKK